MIFQMILPTHQYHRFSIFFFLLILFMMIIITLFLMKRSKHIRQTEYLLMWLQFHASEVRTRKWQEDDNIKLNDIPLDDICYFVLTSCHVCLRYSLIESDVLLASCELHLIYSILCKVDVTHISIADLPKLSDNEVLTQMKLFFFLRLMHLMKLTSAWRFEQVSLMNDVLWCSRLDLRKWIIS